MLQIVGQQCEHLSTGRPPGGLLLIAQPRSFADPSLPVGHQRAQACLEWRDWTRQVQVGQLGLGEVGNQQGILPIGLVAHGADLAVGADLGRVEETDRQRGRHEGGQQRQMVGPSRFDPDPGRRERGEVGDEVDNPVRRIGHPAGLGGLTEDGDIQPGFADIDPDDGHGVLLTTHRRSATMGRDHLTPTVRPCGYGHGRPGHCSEVGWGRWSPGLRCGHHGAQGANRADRPTPTKIQGAKSQFRPSVHPGSFGRE